MRILILLFIFLVTSCRSIGYYPLYETDGNYVDLINHGIHWPCTDYEVVSFTIQIAGYPNYYVKGNNIPEDYRRLIDTNVMCPENCTIYIKDVVYKNQSGEILKSKKKFYIDIPADYKEN